MNILMFLDTLRRYFDEALMALNCDKIAPFFHAIDEASVRQYALRGKKMLLMSVDTCDYLADTQGQDACRLQMSFSLVVNESNQATDALRQLADTVILMQALAAFDCDALSEAPMRIQSHNENSASLEKIRVSIWRVQVIFPLLLERLSNADMYELALVVGASDAHGSQNTHAVMMEMSAEMSE